MDPPAVRADPGRAVTDAPLVFLETIRADLEAAGAVPAKRFFLLAAVTDKRFFSAAITAFFRFVTHGFLRKNKNNT